MKHLFDTITEDQTKTGAKISRKFGKFVKQFLSEHNQFSTRELQQIMITEISIRCCLQRLQNSLDLSH